MINWRTTLGGAIFGLGTFLQGGILVSNWTSMDLPSQFSKYCLMAGFLLQGIGGFVTAIFARDKHVSDEQVGAGQKPPVPVEIVKPLTPPPPGATNPP